MTRSGAGIETSVNSGTGERRRPWKPGALVAVSRRPRSSWNRGESEE
jgi:hypothetical protein